MFIVIIVAITYGLSLLEPPKIFDLGVWSFSGFASLFPLVFAALYWRRTTRAGAIASIVVMAAVWGYFFYRGLLEPSMNGELHAEGDYLVAGLMPVTFIFAASAVTLVVVSLVTKPLPSETVDRFFPGSRSVER